ncbi:MAG TPA: Abi-alpha family protein [Thermoleophilaceae bacterium]
MTGPRAHPDPAAPDPGHRTYRPQGAAHRPSRQPDAAALLRAAPVLARLAASAWWRAAGWTVETSVRTGVRVARGAATGESPAELIQETEAALRDYARRLLGVGEHSPNGTGPAEEPAAAETIDGSAVAADGHVSRARLREQGAELLRRSAEIDFDEDAHPAYARILTELAPDEGRILRLLCREGPQAAVDVRTAGPIGLVKSDLVAPGLTMIAIQAGCRHIDRVHPYLNNLERLGLIWFSREPLEDLQRYHVLEAQPDVVEAMREAGGRTKTVRRSIHLTAFGDDFCETCLPMETVELDALPASAATPREEPEGPAAPG